MLVKIAILFLAVMAVIAWVGSFLGRLRLPGSRRDAFCPSCGRPRIGTGRCPCGRA